MARLIPALATALPSLWAISPVRADVLLVSQQRYVRATTPTTPEDRRESFAPGEFDQTATSGVIGPPATWLASASQRSQITPVSFESSGFVRGTVEGGAGGGAVAASFLTATFDVVSSTPYSIQARYFQTVPSVPNALDALLELTGPAGTVHFFRVTPSSPTLDLTGPNALAGTLAPGRYTLTFRAGSFLGITGTAQSDYSLHVSVPQASSLLALGASALAGARRKRPHVPAPVLG